MLRSFEAAARYGHFKGAAEELRLSPSAISHSVRQLEEALGVKLFERAGRGVRPTLEGLALLTRLSVAFDEIRRGIEDVGQRGSALLRIHSAPSFAALWLAPRLKQFTTLHEQIELRLSADTQYARFTPDDFDVDIVYGPVRAESVIVIPMGEEEVTPLCAPAIASRIGTIEDIVRFPLIQSEQKQVRWDDWLKVNGVNRPLNRHLRFDRSFMALAAARNELGIAFESVRLAEESLANGQLVAPFARGGGKLYDSGHRLVLPRNRPTRKPVRLFVTWLLEGLGLSVPPLI
ncbi:LysR substrate-binding domain-containing protein [Rhizobium sp. C1]|uniref:LysR substrate-binding domain-containing protein n=1 Tax=Rhizobium sp. C1 TaxID=1349799 RepID=UPI001E31648D|nr:LysR substrate-binding domain-containing protein [Rhizobium sp. C1]MCD2178589.1 LysR substrate-binding domain-containing protein [Rhizobium sp. C1]